MSGQEKYGCVRIGRVWGGGGGGKTVGCFLLSLSTNPTGPYPEPICLRKSFHWHQAASPLDKRVARTREKQEPLSTKAVGSWKARQRSYEHQLPTLIKVEGKEDILCQRAMQMNQGPCKRMVTFPNPPLHSMIALKMIILQARTPKVVGHSETDSRCLSDLGGQRGITATWKGIS